MDSMQPPDKPLDQVGVVFVVTRAIKMFHGLDSGVLV